MVPGMYLSGSSSFSVFEIIFFPCFLPSHSLVAFSQNSIINLSVNSKNFLLFWNSLSKCLISPFLNFLMCSRAKSIKKSEILKKVFNSLFEIWFWLENNIKIRALCSKSRFFLTFCSKLFEFTASKIATIELNVVTEKLINFPQGIPAFFMIAGFFLCNFWTISSKNWIKSQSFWCSWKNVIKWWTTPSNVFFWKLLWFWFLLSNTKSLTDITPSSNLFFKIIKSFSSKSIGILFLKKNVFVSPT